MSLRQLTSRNKSMSQATIRRKLLRSGSSDRQELTRNTTAASFRPKLQRLIQQGKLQQILNSDPHSKANLFYNTHINQMEKELAASKKALSTMVLKSKAKQYSINKIKHQIKKIEHQSSIIKKQAFFASTNLNNKKQQLVNIKEGVEEKLWKEKSFIHMKDRLIDDEVFLKALHQKKDVIYKKVLREYAEMEDKFYQLQQLNKQLSKMNQEAKKISNEQTKQKNQFIDVINQDMIEKDMLDNLKAQKNKKDQQINYISSSIIEKQQLAKYLEILFTHRILSQIIKTKSNHLLQKYKNQTNAYMHIKSNTNISEFDKIIQRMEFQDQAYQASLKKVNQLEKQLLRIDQDVKISIQNRNVLYSTQMNSKKGHYFYQGIHKDKNQLLLSQKFKLLEQKKNNQILKKKIILWAENYYKLYDVRATQTQNFFENLSYFVKKVQNKTQRNE